MPQDKPAPKIERSLNAADTQLGIAESALLKACHALNRHGGRDNMISQLRVIRDQIRALNPIREDIEL